jgi:hypothetical protein
MQVLGAVPNECKTLETPRLPERWLLLFSLNPMVAVSMEFDAVIFGGLAPLNGQFVAVLVVMAS